MGEVLKGNFKPRRQVVVPEAKEDLNSQFEREALKRLGGSIAFVSKKTFMYTGGEEGSAGDTKKDAWRCRGPGRDGRPAGTAHRLGVGLAHLREGEPGRPRQRRRELGAHRHRLQCPGAPADAAGPGRGRPGDRGGPLGASPGPRRGSSGIPASGGRSSPPTRECRGVFATALFRISW